jgi:hypothetical protein
MAGAQLATEHRLLTRLTTAKLAIQLLERRSGFLPRATPQWVLFMHTDGVSARFEPEGLSASTWRDPQRLADEVLPQRRRRKPAGRGGWEPARRATPAPFHHLITFTTSSRRSGGMSYARSHSHPGR